MYISTKKTLSRRTLLKGAGVALGLPLLDAMIPAFAAVTPRAARPVRRFIGISLELGLHGPFLLPKDSGDNYTPSYYLEGTDDIRPDFSIISGTSHPGVSGGHAAEASILTAHPMDRDTGRKNTISLDQLMVKSIGHETRFPSLVLNTRREVSTSFTDTGSMIPPVIDPRALFAQLFIEDSPDQKKRQAEINSRGRSILDLVRSDARALDRKLGPADREKLDQWQASVRDLELRLEANEAWIDRPKPKVEEELAAPDINDTTDQIRAMLDVVALAFRTDSTRIATLHCTGGAIRSIKGTQGSGTYHTLTHHGKDPKKIDILALVEKRTIEVWAHFIRDLKRDGILDETMVLLTSNLGNASSHDNTNMPVLFAGGGFKHGRHLAFSPTNNHPLPNLYLDMLLNMGLDHKSFASSTGTLL